MYLLMTLPTYVIKPVTARLDLSGLDSKETESVLGLYFKHGPHYQVNFDMAE